MTTIQRVTAYGLVGFNAMVVLYIIWCTLAPLFKGLMHSWSGPDTLTFILLMLGATSFFSILGGAIWSSLRANKLRWGPLVLFGMLSILPVLFISMLALAGSGTS